MDKETFVSTCEDLKQHIVKEVIPKTDHLQYRTMQSGLNFADDRVLSQYIELINPSMHLAKVTSKLNSLEKPLLDPNNSEVIDPKVLSDELVRYCELNRTKRIYAYRHNENGLVYGIVSPQHKIVQDLDVWNIANNFFNNIPCSYQFEHSTFRMRIGIILDDIAVELAGNNSMKFRVSIGNSMFGVGSAFVMAGSWEKWCSNGATGWRSKVRREWQLEGFKGKFGWRQSHVVQPDIILRGMEKAIIDILGTGDKYMELIREANEVNEPIFKENEDIVKALQDDRYKLLQREAKDVYRLMRTKHRQYERFNGLDTGRAIAEVARDTLNHDRAIELEAIAGKVMLMQISTKS